MDRRTFLPTYRGRILDRYGRVLAEDRASYDVAVEYDVITGSWVRAKAREQARKEIGRKNWNSMSPDDREQAINARVPEWESRRDRMWDAICRLGQIENDDLTRRLDAIKADVHVKAISQQDRQFQREQEKYGISEAEFKPEPIREQNQPHTILHNVADEVAYEFRRLAVDMPGMFQVRASHHRDYPWQSASVPLDRSSLPLEARSDKPMTIDVIGVADHILGAMRDEIWATDIERRPFMDSSQPLGYDLGGYRLGDSVGNRGVETVFEDHLRGTLGMVRERVSTGEQQTVDPKPGNDVQLTLDVALQARIQAILTPQFGLTRVQSWQSNKIQALPMGTPLNAAAVVIEVETGEVLAMVSMPTIAMGRTMTELQQAVNEPTVNRATDALYPPGSILKPFTLVAAAMENKYAPGAPIECTGHYFKDIPDRVRCWIYRTDYSMRTHGLLQAEEALAQSCNIFFYTLADRVGVDQMCKWFGRFGMAQVIDVGVRYPREIERTDGQRTTIWIGESAGHLPMDENGVPDRLTPGPEVMLGIGQGPILWTPLQAANAYATLARNGVIRDATLVMNDPRGPRSRRCEDLNLPPKLVDVALEGLRQSVMERYGTGHHISRVGGPEEPIINAQGVTVWAKTGTAQAPPMRADTNGDGVLDSRDAPIGKVDHSWFVGLVGPKGAKRPLHAIAVIVEYGGSGGRTAGPVANQIIRALQAEGYLPGDPHAAAPGGAMRHAVEPEPRGEEEDTE
jgi:penicillin-binding protein 2